MELLLSKMSEDGGEEGGGNEAAAETRLKPTPANILCGSIRRESRTLKNSAFNGVSNCYSDVILSDPTGKVSFPFNASLLAASSSIFKTVLREQFDILTASDAPITNPIRVVLNCSQMVLRNFISLVTTGKTENVDWDKMGELYSGLKSLGVNVEFLSRMPPKCKICNGGTDMASVEDVKAHFKAHQNLLKDNIMKIILGDNAKLEESMTCSLCAKASQISRTITLITQLNFVFQVVYKRDTNPIAQDEKVKAIQKHHKECSEAVTAQENIFLCGFAEIPFHPSSEKVPSVPSDQTPSTSVAARPSPEKPKTTFSCKTCQKTFSV